MSITKILDLIPQNLHDQLIEEVKELIKEREKEELEKTRNEVSPMMKLYLAREKEQREKEKRERINPY